MGVQGTLVEEVLNCPEVPHNLLLVRRMQQVGMKITFDKNGVQVTKDGKVIIKGEPRNNLVVVDFIIDKNKEVILKFTTYLKKIIINCVIKD